MAQQPTRKAAPKSLLPKGSGTVASVIDFRSLARRFPLFEGIDKLTSRDEIITTLDERTSRQYQNRDALDHLLYISAVVEKAVAIGEIRERDPDGKSVEDFVRGVSKLTLSYVRLGRRLLKAATDGVGNEPTTLDKAFEFYEKADADRATTGFKFKVAQPTGVLYARDALKAYTKYAAFTATGKTHVEGLAEVDRLYPTDVVRVRDPSILTPAQRRAVLEAIAIEAIALVIESGNEKGAEYVERWPTVQAFLEWAEQHVYSPEDEVHQIALHGAGKWDEVNLLDDEDESISGGGLRLRGRAARKMGAGDGPRLSPAKKAPTNGRKKASNGRRKKAASTE